MSSLSFLIRVYHQVPTLPAPKHVSNTSSLPRPPCMAPGQSHSHLLSGPPRWPAPNLTVLQTNCHPHPKSGRSILKHSCDDDSPLFQNQPPKIQSKSINMTLGGHLAASSRNVLPLMTVVPFTPNASGAWSVPSLLVCQRLPHRSLRATLLPDSSFTRVYSALLVSTSSELPSPFSALDFGVPHSLSPRHVTCHGLNL